MLVPPYGPNYAKEPMTITSTGHVYDRGHDKMDGEDVSAGTGPGQYNSQDFWENTMGWSFSGLDPVWEMGPGPNPLPKLIGVGP